MSEKISLDSSGITHLFFLPLWSDYGVTVFASADG